MSLPVKNHQRLSYATDAADNVRGRAAAFLGTEAANHTGIEHSFSVS
jgi:hypothetical protein